MNYVIIGSSISAVSATEAIRRNDLESQITIITAEENFRYSRPLITHFLSNELDEENISFRPNNFFAKNNVRVIYGTKTINVDCKNHFVVTKDKQSILYDKLLLATGAKPILPDIKGIKGDGVFTFWTLEDAKKIKAYIGNVKSAVVIGVGLIGLNVARTLNKLSKKVTVAELLSWPMPLTLDKQAGTLLKTIIQKDGIDILFNTNVIEVVRSDGNIKAITLSNGQTISCELVIIAVGVKPNIELARQAGIKTNYGVLVNKKCETSVSDIYAAGDVTEAFDSKKGEKVFNPNWINAYRQGWIAGNNLSGKTIDYEGSIAINSIEYGGLPFISMGNVNPVGKEYEIFTHQSFTENAIKNGRSITYRKMVFRDNHLVGAIFVGDIRCTGFAFELIKNKTDISKIKNKIATESRGFFTFFFDTKKEDFQGKLKWKENIFAHRK